MPSFLSRQGSNRLQRARKTDDQAAAGATTTTTTGTTKGVDGPGGGGAATAGRESAEIAEPRRSFVSFTRRNSTSSNNPKPLQRSESWKRRFNLNILTRGKNRTSTEQQQEQQGAVSSRIGDVRHQSTGSAKAGESGARSKDGAPLHLRGSAQQQQQQTSALGAAVAPTKSKLSKARPPALSSSPSRLPVLTRSTTKPPSHLGVQSRSALPPPVIASAPPLLSLGLSPQQPQPQQQQQQQQHQEQERGLEREQEQHQQQEPSDGMAATTSTTTTTATMTSVMQEPKRSFSLTLTVDELPRSHPHHQQQQQQQASSPPPQTQRSHHHYHPSSASPPPPTIENPSNQSPMLNARKSSLPIPSPSLPDPNAQKQTPDAFFRSAPIEPSRSVAPQPPAGLSESIGTPLSYYITPSQTPTLPDRSSGDYNPTSIPTVMRPGPATPPPTESGSTSSTTKLTILTDPSNTQLVPWQGTNPQDAASEDRAFNGPPTPASSASSQTNPGKHVNFVGQLDTTPTSSIRSVNSNLGNTYPNPPPQNRFNNYRPPPPHPHSGPRNNGPRQLPLRGPPYWRVPPRLPLARPPSPIFINPPNMKTHLWAPLRPTQINCAAGHTFIPFRNKQHSILCTICRSMEFEGRGEPVKRSFYCSWCAVRMCADCREELMEECGGKLTELWNRTEEKRASNMVKVKEGKMKMVKRGDVHPTSQIPTGSNGESFGPGGGAPITQGDARSRTPQEIPFTATESFPFPEQSPLPPPQRQPQPQHSKSPLPQSRTPGPEQSGAPQPQQSSTSLLQPQTSQLEQPKKRQPQQPRTPQSSTPQLQSQTPQPKRSKTPQSSTPRLQSRTPQPEQSRTPQPRESRIQPPQQPRSPRPSMDKRPSDRRLVPQQSRSTNQVPQAPEKQGHYRSVPRGATRSHPSRLPTRSNMSASPPPVPQLTLAETERYKLIPVPSQKPPPPPGTVVLVGEKQKAPSIVAPSLKGSLKKKKKKGWFRGFGKKKKDEV